MKKWILIISMLFLACSGPVLKKQITFSDGKAAEIEIEYEETPERIVHVTFKNDEKVIKEKTVFKQVEEIWKEARTEAEKENVEEGLIKYVYLSDFDEEKKKPIYKIILFEATKTESGTWTIRKVS